MKIRFFNKTMRLICLIIVVLTGCSVPEPPAPYGVVPTKDQIEWQKLEYYMFICFGPNTFTDVEWGDGKEDPKVFNPTALDCRQWAATAKAAGMKAIIITAKHHDGFCLFPSKYSAHTIRESAWKDGKGDVLKEMSDACREYGLKLGIYLSPWDRNHPLYGTPEYNQAFSNTLDEVLTNYGEVFEVWFDGACGEGPNGKKQVYDWDLFHKTVHRNQPHAMIAVMPSKENGCRWNGNEKGVAGETNWSTMNIEVGSDPLQLYNPLELANTGERGGNAWLPAESDVSIRPGWFYSSNTDNKVKPLDWVLDIYYTSVGRNSNLLLNVPPDRRGLIHPNDSVRLMEFRKITDETFAVNLAQNAKFTASHTRGKSSKYGAKNLSDGKFDTYWATDDNQLSASIEIDFNKDQTFNRLMLQEYISLGQRVKSFSVEYWDGNIWQPVDTKDIQTTIGYKRILRFPTITAQKLKVHIEESLACPVLNEIGVYIAPEITFIDNNMQSSETAYEKFDIAPTKWNVVAPEGNNLDRAIDGNPYSVCVLPEKQQAIIISLGEELSLKGFSYYPVNGSVGNIYRYHFYASIDGKKWDQVQCNASFGNIQNNPIPQFVRFEQPVKANYIKLEAIETVESNERVSIGEIGVITQ